MTLLELLDRTTAFFVQKNIESPRLQVECLLAHVLQKKRLTLYLEFDRPMQESELDRLRPLVKRRSEGEPLQHILGETEFYGLKIICSPQALIPRPETEILAEKVIHTLEKEPPGTLVDVGTGTGCLALTCAAHLPGWNLIGTDISPQALALARENNALNDSVAITWMEGNLLSPLEEAPDAIVANLPYLTAEEMKHLPPEVTHEPSLALTGGAEGLDLIRSLLESIPGKTQHCFLETGIAHQEKVRPLLKNAGFETIELFPDLTGRNRFLAARKAGKGSPSRSKPED